MGLVPGAEAAPTSRYGLSRISTPASAKSSCPPIPFPFTGPSGAKKGSGGWSRRTSRWISSATSSLPSESSEAGFGMLISKNGTFVTHPDKNLIMKETLVGLARNGESPSQGNRQEDARRPIRLCPFPYPRGRQTLMALLRPHSLQQLVPRRTIPRGRTGGGHHRPAPDSHHPGLCRTSPPFLPSSSSPAPSPDRCGPWPKQAGHRDRKPGYRTPAGDVAGRSGETDRVVSLHERI